MISRWPGGAPFALIRSASALADFMLEEGLRVWHDRSSQFDCRLSHQRAGSGARRRGELADQTVRRRGMCEKGQQQTERALRIDGKNTPRKAGREAVLGRRAMGRQASEMGLARLHRLPGREEKMPHNARAWHEKAPRIGYRGWLLGGMAGWRRECENWTEGGGRAIRSGRSRREI